MKIATFFEKMLRPRGDNDLVVRLSNSKILLVVSVGIKRLLMYQKCLNAMRAIKESRMPSFFFLKSDS